ncbi:DUF2807 domain-containing protein [Maribacter sp.]|nr:DUF2807 domain-containing protein [Maribacter sp.]
MKKVTLLVALLCCFHAFSQRKPKIKGNKNVVEVQEDLPAFNAIDLKDDLKIELRKGRQDGVFITADDNLIDVLKFEVVDSVLEIGSFYKITGKKKLEIVVNYTELESVIVRDGAIESSDNIVSDVFSAKLLGSAKIEMNVNAAVINLKMEGNSSGDLNFQSDTLNLDIRDRVDVRVYSVSEWTKVSLMSNANIKLEGTAYGLSAHLYDNSNLRAAKLEAEGVEIIAEGSPSARVLARKDFELTSKGSSKTYLSGNPKIDIIEFLDTSELHKEKE